MIPDNIKEKMIAKCVKFYDVPSMTEGEASDCTYFKALKAGYLLATEERGWVDVKENTFPRSEELIGYSPEWVSENNPEGTRLCYYHNMRWHSLTFCNGYRKDTTTSPAFWTHAPKYLPIAPTEKTLTKE